MPPDTQSLRSSITTKIFIGLTGFLLFLYLILHLLGNVLVFLGPEIFNEYSHTLISNPLIVPIELALLVVFLIHVFKAVGMTLDNRGARPTPYAVKKPAGSPSRKSLASSTMIYSGLLVLVFIILHVKGFKYGAEYQVAGTEMRDLYRLEMENFSSPLMVGFYLISIAFVGFHLWHGVASSLQSLGLDHPRFTPGALKFGKGMAVVIAAGFMFIALWAFFIGSRS